MNKALKKHHKKRYNQTLYGDKIFINEMRVCLNDAIKNRTGIFDVLIINGASNEVKN